MPAQSLYTSIEFWVALAIILVLPPVTIRIARTPQFGTWRLAAGYGVALAVAAYIAIQLQQEPVAPVGRQELTVAELAPGSCPSTSVCRRRRPKRVAVCSTGAMADESFRCEREATTAS